MIDYEALLWKEIERQSKIASPLTPPLVVTCIKYMVVNLLWVFVQNAI